MDLTVLQLAKNYVDGGIKGISDFMQNVDVDYEYDATTNANYTVVRVYKNKLNGSKQFPFAYAPNGNEACEKTSKEIATEDGWCLVINGGVFNTSTHIIDGQFMENGVVIQNTSASTHSGVRPLAIDSNGDFSELASNADLETLSGIQSVITGFMAIIKDWESVSSSEWPSVQHFAENTQRQIIGQFGNGDYGIVTCEGRNADNSDGWTVAEAQTICEKLGLKFAYLLDGGGSTETCIGLKMFNHIYEGTSGRKVPSFIVFNGSDVFPIVPTPPTPPPSPYTTIHSVKKTGYGSYIDLGIAPDASWTVEYQVDYQNTLSGGPHILSAIDFYYPMIKGTPTANVFAIHTPLGDHFGGTQTYIDSFPASKKIKFNGATRELLIDDVVMTTASTDKITSSSNNLTMFAYPGGRTGVNYNATDLAIQYCKIWDSNNALIHDFEPRKRLSDNVIGMLDLVTDTFYPSSGSDAFTEGAVIN